MSVAISRTQHVGLIKSIVTHPKIYPHVADDTAPPPEEFDPSVAAEHPGYYFLVARDGEEVLGLFMVHQHNGVMFEIHTCLLPSAWGERALEAGRAVLRWVFDNTPCEKLITFVPKYNRLAKKFALACGLVEEGVVSSSYKKNGRLLDQHLLGIEKGKQ